MKSTTEINYCILPSMGEEGNPSLNESFLVIFFVWSGSSVKSVEKHFVKWIRNINFCLRGKSLSVNTGVSLRKLP